MSQALKANAAWDSLLAAGVLCPPGMFDMFGSWESEEHGGWYVRHEQDRMIRFGPVDANLDVLVESLQTSHELSDRVGELDLRREVLRQAAMEVDARQARRSWEAAAAAIALAMTSAVVAVPVGGV